jgi:hypothetical protein
MPTYYKAVRVLRNGRMVSLLAPPPFRCAYKMHQQTYAKPGTVGLFVFTDTKAAASTDLASPASLPRGEKIRLLLGIGPRPRQVTRASTYTAAYWIRAWYDRRASERPPDMTLPDSVACIAWFRPIKLLDIIRGPQE